jgi:ATP-dependent DNA helicase RecG
VATYQRLHWNEQATIAIVGVETGFEKPYAVRSGEGRRYYMRVGSTSREPSREELIRLTQASGAVASDLRPVLGASAGDLVPELVAERFAGRRTLDFAALGAKERRRVLVDAEILHPDTEGPTIAGLLCFGRAPQERLPYATLSCVAYSGTEPGRELADRAEVGGRVDEQIRGGLEFIARNLRAASTVRGGERVEAARPSTESLRELIANAVCHRHYGIAGPIQVRVFTDRIEVTNPGAPPNGVTPQAMRVGVSIWRNQFLVQHLTSLGFVDAVGRGIVLLFEEAARLGLPEPSITVVETWTTIELGLEG